MQKVSQPIATNPDVTHARFCNRRSSDASADRSVRPGAVAPKAADKKVEVNMDEVEKNIDKILEGKIV